MASNKSCGSDIFKKKTFCVITGASRGLGKSIAVNFANKFADGSCLLLLARDKLLLDGVKSKIESVLPDITVVTRHFDQSKVDSAQTFCSLFSNVFEDEHIEVVDFEQAMLVHNAATIGDPTKYVRELNNADKVRHCFDMNVTGMLLLNTSFLQTFPRDSVKSRVVINMSAVPAVTPYSSWSLYCAGKAARYMFFRVLAAEEPDIRVLNYAPGLCLTDMLKEAGESKDPKVKEFFEDILAGKAMAPSTSIEKLIEILQKNSFDSGAHVDYNDPI